MNLFMATFEELCNSFNKVPYKSPTKTTEVFFQEKWTTGTIKDLIVKYLKEHNFPLLYVHQRLWFSRDGHSWESYEYTVTGSVVTFYVAK